MRATNMAPATFSPPHWKFKYVLQAVCSAPSARVRSVSMRIRPLKRVAGAGHGFLRLCGRRGAARLLGGHYEKTRPAQARGIPAGVAAAPAGVRRRGSVRRLPGRGGGVERGLCVRRGLYCPPGVDCAECALALQVAPEVPQRGQEMLGG